MEAPPTYRTAEDMHISYIIRKYLGKVHAVCLLTLCG